MVSCVVNSRPHPRRASQSRPSVRNFFFLNFRPLFSCAAHSSKFRTLFQVAYTLSPLLATLMKTAAVYTNNSRSATHLPAKHTPFISLTCANQDLRPTCFYAPSWRNATVNYHHCLRSFSSNTYGSPHTCCKQRLSFRCNTYKKQGVSRDG